MPGLIVSALETIVLCDVFLYGFWRLRVSLARSPAFVFWLLLVYLFSRFIRFLSHRFLRSRGCIHHAARAASAKATLSVRLAIERRPALFFPLSRSLEALRRLMALAGALLEVFGLVVVALEALQDLGDARFPFFSLRGRIMSSRKWRAFPSRHDEPPE